MVLRPKHGAPYGTRDNLGSGHVQLQLDCRPGLLIRVEEVFGAVKVSYPLPAAVMMMKQRLEERIAVAATADVGAEIKERRNRINL